MVEGKKGGGKLTIKRHESLMRNQLLFMAGGREDSGEDHIVLRGEGKEDQSSPTE